MYDKDTDNITKDITQMIHDSIDEMAPIIKIQITDKNKNPISQEAKKSIENRDKAHKIAKEDPTIENLRNFRNLRNLSNRLISKERYSKRKERFQKDGVTNNKKWKLIKEDTGQNQFKTPEVIKEGSKIHTKPREIAQAMNRLYISSVRETINKIPRSNTDPLIHYKEALGPVDTHLNLEQISMAQFLKTYNTMTSTSSSASDFISMRILKEAGTTIHPHLHHLVNTVIYTEKFPSTLKITKIVPIPKSAKDPTILEGWRPINVVPALSKVIEKCLLKQVLKYLGDNNFINHSHHGSVSSKSTQTLIQEIYEMLLTTLEEWRNWSLHPTRPKQSLRCSEPQSPT